jgi:glycosyltransferase involved in cell wall biosynthesis
MSNKLYIITNESFYLKDNKYFCDNIDLKSIPEEISKNKEIFIICRNSKIPRTKHVNIKKIQNNNNILSYLISIIKSFDAEKKEYLIISISPFTFFASLILKIFLKRHFIYLRSDGHEEYKSILGFIGPLIYSLMFNIASINSNLISCRKHILKNKNGEIVHPSQLNEKWFLPEKKLDLDKINLLYVGRIRVEKGIFSLLDLIEDSKINLTIVTSEKEIKLKKKLNNVKVTNFENYDDAIIKFYDEHNIFILPSYTEGHPQVLDEALARMRPVIIFEEISHVTRGRKGVFICNRNLYSLEKTINYIKNNYSIITKEMKKNTLPTKKSFINELTNIIFKN